MLTATKSEVCAIIRITVLLVERSIVNLEISCVVKSALHFVLVVDKLKSYEFGLDYWMLE